MGDTTTIQWTDATWNPIRGCSKVSEGCRFCYAMAIAARFSGPGLAYEGLGKMTSAGPAWTGKVRTVPKHLADPLRWARPRRIFVNSMSDLFHEALAPEQIAEVFAVMYLASQHTFQVLTKRAHRMCEVLSEPGFINLMGRAASRICGGEGPVSGLRHPVLDPATWVHLGVSVESADHLARLTELRNTPAGLRFASFEPLLGDLGNIKPWLYGPGSLDWAIVGGESGHSARRLDVAWVRSIVKQCRAAAVPVFVKQMGANVIDRNDAGFNGDEGEERGWCSAEEYGGHIRVEENIDGYRDDYQGAPVRVHLSDSHGGDPAEWPEDLRVRQFPEVRHG